MNPTEPTPAPGPADPTRPIPQGVTAERTEPTPAPPSSAEHTSPAPPAPRPERGQEHPPRVSTMVWGLLTIVVGLVAMAVATGRHVDLEIALISIFLLAGLGLLIGAGWSAWQRSSEDRRRRNAPWEAGR